MRCDTGRAAERSAVADRSNVKCLEGLLRLRTWAAALAAVVLPSNTSATSFGSPLNSRMCALLTAGLLTPKTIAAWLTLRMPKVPSIAACAAKMAGKKLRRGRRG